MYGEGRIVLSMVGMHPATLERSERCFGFGPATGRRSGPACGASTNGPRSFGTGGRCHFGSWKDEARSRWGRLRVSRVALRGNTGSLPAPLRLVNRLAPLPRFPRPRREPCHVARVGPGGLGTHARGFIVEAERFHRLPRRGRADLARRRRRRRDGPRPKDPRATVEPDHGQQ